MPPWQPQGGTCEKEQVLLTEERRRGEPKRRKVLSTRRNNLLLQFNSACHLARFVHLPRLFPLSSLEWKATELASVLITEGLA